MLGACSPEPRDVLMEKPVALVLEKRGAALEQHFCYFLLYAECEDHPFQSSSHQLAQIERVLRVKALAAAAESDLHMPLTSSSSYEE